MRMRRSHPLRVGVALTVVVLLLFSSLMAIRADVAPFFARHFQAAERQASINAPPSENMWHVCADPACVICTAQHVSLDLPAPLPMSAATPTTIFVVPSLYAVGLLPWPLSPPPSVEHRPQAASPRAPPQIV